VTNVSYPARKALSSGKKEETATSSLALNAQSKRKGINKEVLFHFIWAGLMAKFGRAEATREGLAFPNRASREPLGAEDV